MKTLMQQLEEKMQKDAASSAYKELSSLRASAEYLRIESNTPVTFCGGEMTYRKAFNMLHNELKRVVTERNVKNKISSIVRKLAEGEKR